MQGPEPFLEKLGVELPGAVDPKTKAVLDPSHRAIVNGHFHWTSSQENLDAFRASAYEYTGPVLEPNSHEWFTPTPRSPRRDIDGEILYFASEESAQEFDESGARPVRHVSGHRD